MHLDVSQHGIGELTDHHRFEGTRHCDKQQYCDHANNDEKGSQQGTSAVTH
jgi:hypothetical protein